MLQEKTFLSSPFGCFEVRGSRKGLRSVQLTDRKHCPDLPVPAELREAVSQLKEYFAGTRKEFDLELDFEGSPPFHQAVWRELITVPYGQTVSYSDIAENLGDLKSVRAVGQASARNPIAIVVPCHRCLAKNGDLQGYFYGLDMKRRLLEMENPLQFARQGELF